MRTAFQPLPYLLVIALLSSCGIFRSGPGDGIPDFLSDVHWEMAPWELLESRSIEKVHERPFREVYQESEPENEEIQDIIYYFGVLENSSNRPLYEIIINFKSEEVRNDYAAKHLGDPNTEDGKWQWEVDSDAYQAWKFQNKLVLVKVVSGTEWDE